MYFLWGTRVKLLLRTETLIFFWLMFLRVGSGAADLFSRKKLLVLR